MAMAQQQQQREREKSSFESDSGLSMNIPVALNDDDSHPYFPPPPTAAMKRSHVRQAAHPVEEMPPLPVFVSTKPKPPVVIPPPPPSEFAAPPTSPLPVGKIKRKTLMQRIEGWWDLELLEKRQTLFGRSGSVRRGMNNG
ncbi:hypothetical protein PT974_06024 [Cladobotryum mycophilum]|uniref:Uncharacterized protein n=1 Tax=Cladobotryum mycophilum TaxID=491253 RepID=A0ABR0SLJ1_9HYPO